MPLTVQTAHARSGPGGHPGSRLAALAKRRRRRPVRVQPEGWNKAYRFPALRYARKPEAGEAEEPAQDRLFDTPEYAYWIFVTGMGGSAGNLIQESNHDAGLAAHPSEHWIMNANLVPDRDAGLQPELLAVAVRAIITRNVASSIA